MINRDNESVRRQSGLFSASADGGMSPLCAALLVAAFALAPAAPAMADDLADPEFFSNGYGDSAQSNQGGNEYRSMLLFAQLDQNGNNNQAQLLQSGQVNAIRAIQAGSDNLATLTQSGRYNTIDLDQRGTANIAYVAQSGAGNTALIEQVGYGNRADITQSSTASNAVIRQYGDRNIARIVQH